MPVSDILEIKSNNIQSIIKAARYAESTTKKELTEATGLSAATVSNICNELAQAGIFTYKKDNTHAVGRNPQMISFNYKNFYVICVNLQLKGKLTLALVNARNCVVMEKSYVVDEQWDLNNLADFAKEKYDSEIACALGENGHVIGIGVAVSGTYDIVDKRLVYSAIPQFENVDIKSIVYDKFKVPVYVDNISNICALSLVEQGKKFQNAVYLHCSESVGMGIIANGRLVLGRNGYAGEISSIVKGNESTNISIGAVLNNYYKDGFKNRDIAWSNFKKDVKDNKQYAIEVVDRCASILARTIAWIACVLDSEIIIIGGDISEIEDTLQPILRKYALEIKEEWRIKTPEIRWSTDSNFEACVGLSEKMFTEWMPICC